MSFGGTNPSSVTPGRSSSSSRFKWRDLVLLVTASGVIFIIVFLATTNSNTLDIRHLETRLSALKSSSSLEDFHTNTNDKNDDAAVDPLPPPLRRKSKKNGANDDDEEKQRNKRKAISALRKRRRSPVNHDDDVAAEQIADQKKSSRIAEDREEDSNNNKNNKNVKKDDHADIPQHQKQKIDPQLLNNKHVVIEKENIDLDDFAKNPDQYSSEPEDPVYHNYNPIPRRKKILEKPDKIKINPVTTSKAAENMFDRFYDSFDKTKLYKDGSVVPAMITPTFHDGDVLRDLLEHVDVPVRHLIFICNAEDEQVGKLLRELAPLEKVGGMSVFRFVGENRGFAKSINLGLRRARQVLLGHSEFAFLPKWNSDKLPIWYAPINCDAVFTNGAWLRFTTQVNIDLTKNEPSSDGRVPGLFYGNVIDHYAFGVSDAAIRAAGYFDEVFFPAYMEDIDFKWRIHNAGFRTVQISAARIDHHQSINLKRSDGKSLFKQQMHRGGLGFEYGWMKWGFYGQDHTRWEFPPSKRKYPFNIEGFPIHLWKIDWRHRECLFSGAGTYLLGSSTCWYNGTGLLEELPPKKEGDPKPWKLPRYLREPVESLRDFLKHGTNNDRFE